MWNFSLCPCGFPLGSLFSYHLPKTFKLADWWFQISLRCDGVYESSYHMSSVSGIGSGPTLTWPGSSSCLQQIIKHTSWIVAHKILYSSCLYKKIWYEPTMIFSALACTNSFTLISWQSYSIVHDIWYFTYMYICVQSFYLLLTEEVRVLITVM